MEDSKTKKDATAKSKKPVFIIVIVVLLAAALGAFFLFNNQDSNDALTPVIEDNLEQPMFFINTDDELKINLSTMETPQLLGNQGFSKTSMFTPLATSADNKNIAYITDLNALFLVPTADATGGVISSDHLIAEKAEEVIAFAPDNNNILYYVDTNGNLAMYDASSKEHTIITEKFYSGSEDLHIPVLLTANNRIIVYYEIVEGELQLCIKDTSSKKDPVRLFYSLADVLTTPDSEGFYFYERDELMQNAPDSEQASEMLFKFYNFESGSSKTIGTVTATTENIAKSNDGRGIFLDALTTPEEKLGSYNVINYQLTYFDGTSTVNIDDNVIKPVFANENCGFVIYNKEVDGGHTVYYKNLKIAESTPVELVSAVSLEFLEYSYSTSDNSIAVSSLGEDNKSLSMTKFNFAENGDYKDKIAITNTGFSLLSQVIGGNYTYIENPNVLEIAIEGVDDPLKIYSCDLYTYKDGTPLLVDSNVEISSIGTNSGTDRESNTLFYISDVAYNEEKETFLGTLKMYNGTDIVVIDDDFIVPEPESPMAVFYSNDDLIYYMNFNLDADHSMTLYRYVPGGENQLVDDSVLNLI